MIGDRFLLEERGAESTVGLSEWSAHDTRLDQSVSLLVADGAPLVRGLLERATRLRAAGVPGLARIVSAAEDDGADEPRAYLAFEKPAGVRLDSVIGSRIVPVEIARAIIRSAAQTLADANAVGLRHGNVTAESLTVTPRGAVVVSGIWRELFAAKTVADEASALSTLFALATCGSVEPPEHHVPADLDAAERALVESPAADLSALLGDLHPQQQSLSDLATARFGYASVRTRVEWEAAEAAREEAERLAAEQAAIAAELEEQRRASGELWGIDVLADDEPPVEVPSVTEAILDRLHRKFPESGFLSRALARAQAHQPIGPRFNPAPWLIVLGLAAVSAIAFASWHDLIAPYVPDFDLRNPPPQSYPEFTFTPSASPTAPSG